MVRNRQTALRLVLLSGFAVVLVLLFMSSILFRGLAPTSRLWNGFYTLLVTEDISSDIVVESLYDAGFEHVLAESTATVRYNAVRGTDTVAVSEIHSRFSDVDPRLDPYMSRLPAYFHTLNGRRPMRIYYIHAAAPAMTVHNRAVRSVGRGVLPAHTRDLVLVEWGFWRAALWLAAFAVYVLVLTLRSRVERSATLIASVLWVPWVVIGSAATFIAACVSVFLFVLWIEEVVPVGRAFGAHRRPQLRRLVVRTVFCGIGYVATLTAVVIAGRDGLAATLVAGGGGVVVAALVVYLHWFGARQAEHEPFVPLDILQPGLWDALKGRYASPVLAVAPIVVIPLAVLAFLPTTHSSFVPEPKPVVGIQAFDEESMHRLWTHEEQNSLPDLADYLAHRAYQEGFLYGAEFGFPSTALTMPRFRSDGDTITRWVETLTMYDDAWYQGALRSLAPSSVSELLVEQGAPRSVVFTPVAVIFSRGATVPELFIVVLLIFAPFMVSFTPAASIDLLRGKRQEA